MCFPKNGRLAVYAKCISTYAKIRGIVRAARAHKPRYEVHELASRLAVAIRGSEAALLEKLARKLGSKGRRQRWGNIRKEYDVVGKRLLKLKVRKVSKNRFCQGSLHTFFWASATARAVCLTSNRFLSKADPKTPVPPQEQRWALYGKKAKSRSFKDPQEEESWVKFRAWKTACSERSPFPNPVHPESKLDLHTVQSMLPGLGHFTALQILTDLCIVGCSSVVQLPEDLGKGVKLDRVLTATDIVALAIKLNQSGQFRATYGGRVTVPGLAHLVCELRQWTYAGMKPEAVQRFLQDVGAKCCALSAVRKHNACEAIAQYGILGRLEPNFERRHLGHGP